MITNTRTARTFAQSMAVQAVDLQNALDCNNWDEAADLLDDVESDVDRLRTYVNAKLAEAEAEK